MSAPICCNHDCNQRRTCPIDAAHRLGVLVSETRKQYDAETFGGGEPAYPEWTNDAAIVISSLHSAHLQEHATEKLEPSFGVMAVIVLLFVLLTGACAYISYQNEVISHYTRQAIK